MSELAKVISTDVLVIGGGIAGLIAANKAIDQGAAVLIAEKSTTPWSGQMPLAGGGFSCTTDPSRWEAEIKFFVEEGEYLSDQNWTEAFIKATYKCLQEVAEWGVPFSRTIDGKLKIRGSEGLETPQSEKVLPMLLRRALQKGAKVLNKAYMVDLLKRDGRVVGAVGFHYQTGDFYVVQCKTTIIACGGCNHKARPLFHTNCGEGVAMAYHAGAELRNAEFGNAFALADKYSFRGGSGTRVFLNFFENAIGERLVEKYPDMNPVWEPGAGHRRNFLRWVNAFYKEIDAGRGPIYLNFTLNPEEATGRGDGFSPRDVAKGYVSLMRRLGIDITKEKVEWTMGPEFHAGPIRVDVNSQTTLPGLYAIGDAVAQGSAYKGALPGYPGPLGFVALTSHRAGTAAGKAAATIPEPELSTSEFGRLKKEIFAPLTVKDGYNPYDAIKEIQGVTFQFRNSYVKHKERLEKALGIIEEVQAKLPNLTAKDAHELVRCHEAKSMAICAELLYRASLMRTETRGSNIREDYPERDDKNWLKWIIIRNEGQGMKLWTEPVPIEQYKYRPS